MKFQFLGRMPSLTASVVSDISSSYGETETSTHSSIDRQRSSVVYDEMETTMAMFEWDQSMDSSHLGIAASTVSTFCSMVQSELAGCAYDPSRNHTYKSDESEPRTNTVDEKCRSKMLEWCFKVGGCCNDIQHLSVQTLLTVIHLYFVRWWTSSISIEVLSL
jgi:hypothetical protein